MKQLIIALVVITSFWVVPGHHAAALANPASVKCITDGGTTSIVKDAQGNESGNCTFPNGKVCDEWAYFRGQCTQNVITSMDQLPASCTNAFDGCNSCSRIANGQWACTMMYCFAPGAIACTKYDTPPPVDPVMCTKEYRPVCGQPQMPECKNGMMCPMMMPMNKTYSNACEMKAAGATFVKEGACESSSVPAFCGNTSFKKMNRGVKGEYVRSLQHYLSDHGYNPGTFDGVFGRKVVEAVRMFQKDRGLFADGVFGKKSLQSLCENTYELKPHYDAVITESAGPLVVGSSVVSRDVVINAKNLSSTKTVAIEIVYNAYAIVYNPVITKTTYTTTLDLHNGSNTLSRVNLGPVVSFKIDGEEIPYTQ